MRSYFPWLAAVVVVVLDRLSKLLIGHYLPQGTGIPVMPGLTLTHVHNTGIAFSLFSEGGLLSRIILHFVIAAAVVLIIWMLVHHGARGLMAGLSLGLILGGAVGNLGDRILYGWVVDFIHVWVRIGDRTYAWPDFNVADSAISVGACLLILNELRGRHDKKEAEDASGSG